MGLLTKYCEVCRIQVTKGQDFVRFGNHSCSEGHADKYASEGEHLGSSSEQDSGRC
jgi:hypothetical protein